MKVHVEPGRASVLVFYKDPSGAQFSVLVDGSVFIKTIEIPDGSTIVDAAGQPFPIEQGKK